MEKRRGPALWETGPDVCIDTWDRGLRLWRRRGGPAVADIVDVDQAGGTGGRLGVVPHTDGHLLDTASAAHALDRAQSEAEMSGNGNDGLTNAIRADGRDRDAAVAADWGRG